jgi:acyl carrier protein
MKTCENCRTENPDDAKFCRNCGQLVSNLQVTKKVKAIIADKLCVDEMEVTDTASFTDDLGADSLDVVELITFFESEFGITISDDQAAKISTVGDAIQYINKYLQL